MALGITGSFWLISLWNYGTAISSDWDFCLYCGNRKRTIDAFVGSRLLGSHRLFPTDWHCIVYYIFLINLGTVAKVGEFH